MLSLSIRWTRSKRKQFAQKRIWESATLTSEEDLFFGLIVICLITVITAYAIGRKKRVF